MKFQIVLLALLVFHFPSVKPNVIAVHKFHNATDIEPRLFGGISDLMSGFTSLLSGESGIYLSLIFSHFKPFLRSKIAKF